ncbi:MarR family transcriptional regulator [uncultured Sphingomonas sp.]|uniref:MarR family winged helix-turn-helix transcriptional regulator n=1 Tax=uncultured Sphingomonas sp. TaxID=158754 RepID=UPI002605C801|nr:MarR family transcriptional regulator [uncultured Sphingomonas sp.]
MARAITEEEYRALAGFRQELREFLSFSETAAQDAGLTPQQHQALLAIRAAPKAVLIGELARQLALRPNSVTGLVDRLAKQGLVERRETEGDRRRVPVSLTSRGEELIENLADAHRGELRRIRPLLANLLLRI